MSIWRHKAAWAAHKAKKAKATSTSASGSTDTATASTNYAIWRGMVQADNQHLRSQYPDDHDERNKHKPAFINKYRDYLAEWIASDATHQNEVLVTVCKWATDTRDYAFALVLADAGADQISGMARDLRTFLADAVYQDKGDAETLEPFILEITERLDDERWSLTPPLAAKYFKRGAQLLQGNDNVTALRYAEKAHSTYKNVGVKGLVDSLALQVKQDSSQGITPPKGDVLSAPPAQASGNVTDDDNTVDSTPPTSDDSGTATG